MGHIYPDGALTGLRVLDLSHGIAGPFAARLLGDHGADVIKIERPVTGDFARALPPLKHDTPAPEQSLLFQYLNWNKRSLALDLTSLLRTKLSFKSWSNKAISSSKVFGQVVSNSGDSGWTNSSPGTQKLS
jgi:hypothetical protein